MKKFYMITTERLKELIESELLLTALEQGGVEDWEWYGQALKIFLQ